MGSLLLKLKILISFGIIFLLLFLPLNVSALLPKSIDDDIWVDGQFEGTISIGKSSGRISGMINFGRSSSNGVFKATINIDNEIYDAKGWFINKMVFGFYKNSIISYPLIGKISLNYSSFKMEMKLPQGSIDAKYIASYLPPIKGNYGIGVAEYHLIDDSRMEELTNDPEDYREFMVKVWYPTDKNAEAECYKYMTKTMFTWLMGRAPIPLPWISDKAYEDVKPHGKINAPIASGQNLFPVVLFAHGLDGTIEIYTSFIEELVSRGYVVFSMNHPYVAGVVEFPDGRTVYYDRSLSETIPDYWEIALRAIVEDAKFTVDYAEVLNSSFCIFNGRLDLENIGIYGHSFGGASTAICCAEDERIDCGLTLDGVIYEDILPDGVTKPFFMMVADGNIDSEGVNYIWNKEESDIFKMSIFGSTHYGFTDVGLLLSHMLPLIPPKLLGFGTIDAKIMTELVRLFVVDFFNSYLKGYPIDNIIDLADEFSSYIEFHYK